MNTDHYFVDYCERCKKTFRHRVKVADYCSRCYSPDWDKPAKKYRYQEDDAEEKLTGRSL